MSYVAPEDLEEARAVLAELKRIEQEISDIAAAGRALVSASDPEIEPYRERLISLKLLLKSYARVGTMDPIRKVPTRIERTWFATPISHASSHFHLRTSAGPKRWSSGLSEVRMDISWGVSRLAKEIED